MWKWLRSWFAWRFSLGRLVVAMLLLGVLVGLNCRKIGPMYGPESVWQKEIYEYYWGWPLPVASEKLQWNCELKGEFKEDVQYRFPWTHKTYSFVAQRRVSLASLQVQLFLSWWIIDALVALTVLALILSLQIPRRKGARPR